MGKYNNKCIIKEDGLLAEKVRKYPCLYDKSLPTYKEKDRKANAWRAVETELGLEELLTQDSTLLAHLSPSFSFFFCSGYQLEFKNFSLM